MHAENKQKDQNKVTDPNGYVTTCLTVSPIEGNTRGL